MWLASLTPLPRRSLADLFLRCFIPFRFADLFLLRRVLQLLGGPSPPPPVSVVVSVDLDHAQLVDVDEARVRFIPSYR